MGRGDRVGERARLAVGGALRIFFAQRLQLAESAVRVAKAERGARLDQPRLLVDVRSGIARDQRRGRRLRVAQPPELELYLRVLKRRLVGEDALRIAVTEPPESRGGILIVATVALGRPEKEQRVVGKGRVLVGRERHPLDRLHLIVRAVCRVALDESLLGIDRNDGENAELAQDGPCVAANRGSCQRFDGSERPRRSSQKCGQPHHHHQTHHSAT